MVLLVRYGELALKSAYVRRHLEDRLAANVRDMFAANGAECIVRTERGRLFVHAEDETLGLRLLRRVFGIVSISPANEVPADLDALTREVVAHARRVLSPGQTFAIRPRRSGNHPYTSQDLAKVLGRAVQDAIPGADVDLDAPDREIHVEVRGPRAYVFQSVVEGPGGLPLGSQGEIHAVVEDEAGMVSAWLVMRRGCRARVSGREPFLSDLRAWDPRLVVVDPGSPTAEARIRSAIGPSQEPVTEGAPLQLYPLAGLRTEEVAQLALRVRDA